MSKFNLVMPPLMPFLSANHDLIQQCSVFSLRHVSAITVVKQKQFQCACAEGYVTVIRYYFSFRIYGESRGVLLNGVPETHKKHARAALNKVRNQLIQNVANAYAGDDHLYLSIDAQWTLGGEA